MSRLPEATHLPHFPAELVQAGHKATQQQVLQGLRQRASRRRAIGTAIPEFILLLHTQTLEWKLEQIMGKEHTQARRSFLDPASPLITSIIPIECAIYSHELT
eukprot:1161067-Pelagomonas_calceolata.AAC.4